MLASLCARSGFILCLHCQIASIRIMSFNQIISSCASFHNNYGFLFSISKRTLEEKKAVRDELKNLEKMAMQKVQEKTNTLEMYTKVLFMMRSS